MAPPRPTSGKNKTQTGNKNETRNDVNGSRPISASAQKAKEKREQLTKLQLEKLKKKREDLGKSLDKTQIPQPNPGQLISKELERQQIKARKEIESLRAQLEKCNIQIRGIETGVTDIVEEDLLPRMEYLLALEEDLRDFWLDFRSQSESGHTTDGFVPPKGVCGYSSIQRVFTTAHASAITHDIQALRRYVVDSMCSNEQVRTEEMPSNVWYEADTYKRNTPLHLATIFCGQEHRGFKTYRETAKFLIDAVPFEILTLENEEGDTALHYACASGSVDVVKALLYRKVQLEQENIYQAFEHGRIDLIKWLFSFMKEREQYDVHLENVKRVSLHLVVENFCRKSITKKQYEQLMDYLVKEEGISINTLNHHGETVLHVAAKEQSIYPISLDLLERGANPELIDLNNKLPIQYITLHEKSSMRDMFQFYATHPALVKCRLY